MPRTNRFIVEPAKTIVNQDMPQPTTNAYKTNKNVAYALARENMYHLHL